MGQVRQGEAWGESLLGANKHGGKGAGNTRKQGSNWHAQAWRCRQEREQPPKCKWEMRQVTGETGTGTGRRGKGSRRASGSGTRVWVWPLTLPSLLSSPLH